MDEKLNNIEDVVKAHYFANKEKSNQQLWEKWKAERENHGPNVKQI